MKDRQNFSGIDVTDPRNSKVNGQTELPNNKMRSNFEVTGDIAAVAYQVYELGLPDAGIELFDISDPESRDPSANIQRPDHIPVACIASGMWTVSMYTWQAAHRISRPPPRDDQIYQIIDVRNPPTDGSWKMVVPRDTGGRS